MAARCWLNSATIFSSRRRRPRASLDTFRTPKLVEIPILS